MNACKLLLFLLLLSPALSVFSQSFDQALLKRLQEENHAIVSMKKATGLPGFIRFPEGYQIALPGNTPEEMANHFFHLYGGVFGIENHTDILRISEIRTGAAGGQHLLFDQYQNGIPVFGGELRLHINSDKRLTAVNGVIIPEINLPSMARISASDSRTIALQEVNRQKPNAAAPLFVQKNNLYYYKKGLTAGVDGPVYLVYEVEVRNNADVREFVYVDAIKGNITDQVNGICHALDRRLYETNTSTLTWQEGDAFPGSLDQWQQNEVVVSEHTYNFFQNAFGITSYDDADAQMRTINNPSGLSCPNATWNGSTTNYCDNAASDDVIGHEWGHAYTEYTSNLIYQWQSGALNESFSDIWGEVIDLINGYEDAGEDLSLRTACNSSERWRMGEDAAGFGGAIRDMWDPTCDGHPGKVTDAEYVCGTGDSGGVHTNSGVPNHSFALLVDGGTYNGQTISALGLTKASHIYWRANQLYLVRSSDFIDMADALEASCSDLIGINLEGLSTGAPAGLSGEMITTADCQEVADAIAAVEFRSDTGCGYEPLLAQSPPPLCGGGESVSTIFSDDFESGLGNWTISQIPSNPPTWDAREWIIDSSLPKGRAGSAAYGPDPYVGDCASDLDNGIIRMESQVINIPGTASSPIKMSFDHYVSMENNWDGGNISYSLNGGAWTLLPGSAFTYNAYNKTLNTSGQGNDNPLAGQEAFTGADGGSTSGTWGQSQIDLSNIGLNPGNNIQLRWELGADGCNGWNGWFVDDVTIYTCEMALPIELLSFRAVSEKEHIRLEWVTGQEINNRGFELLRTRNLNKDFEKIAWIPGAGNTFEENRYYYEDQDVRPGNLYYYHLRQIDLDDKVQYSPVVSGKVKQKEADDIRIHPNPVKVGRNIHLSGLKPGIYTFEIFGLNGQLFQREMVTSLSEKEPVSLSLSGLNPGVYFIKTGNRDSVSLKKILLY